jgi:hypothetical protein
MHELSGPFVDQAANRRTHPASFRSGRNKSRHELWINGPGDDTESRSDGELESRLLHTARYNARADVKRSGKSSQAM